MIEKNLDKAILNAPSNQLTYYNYPCVYLLYDKDTIVYVGSSKAPIARITAHSQENKQFDSYRLIKCDKRKMLKLEKQYIIHLKPKYNLQKPNLSKMICYLLTENNLNQSGLAIRFNISRQAMSDKIRKGRWKIDELYKLCKIFNCRMEYLLRPSIQINPPIYKKCNDSMKEISEEIPEMESEIKKSKTKRRKDSEISKILYKIADQIRDETETKRKNG